MFLKLNPLSLLRGILMRLVWKNLLIKLVLAVKMISLRLLFLRIPINPIERLARVFQLLCSMLDLGETYDMVPISISNIDIRLNSRNQGLSSRPWIWNAYDKVSLSVRTLILGQSLGRD